MRAPIPPAKSAERSRATLIAQNEDEEVPPPPPLEDEEASPPAEADEAPAAEEQPRPSKSGPDARRHAKGEQVEITGAMKNMTWVGFQQTADASRVFVKTTAPARFHVSEEGDTMVVLELENTSIPLRNNRRFLDTHFFNSAVTMISPREIEGAGKNVRIEIQLRNRVPYTSGQDDNLVYLDFRRP